MTDNKFVVQPAPFGGIAAANEVTERNHVMNIDMLRPFA